jgi:hypothetical protein
MRLKENAIRVSDVMSGKNMYTQPLFYARLYYALFYFYAPCKLTLFSNLLPHFRFNALHLAAFCYSKPLFLMVIRFFIYAHFLRKRS